MKAAKRGEAKPKPSGKARGAISIEYLDRLESSWADCAVALRATGARKIRSGKRPGFRTQSLLRVHAILEIHRQTFDAGNRAALLWALRECCEENVPLPYWAADGILDVLTQLHTKPASLHRLFGLHLIGLRESGARAKKDRDDLIQSAELWLIVRPLVSCGMSRDLAIKKVLSENPDLPFKQRKAVELYESRERFFKRFKKATTGTG